MGGETGEEETAAGACLIRSSLLWPVQIMRGVDWAIVRQYLTLKGGPGKAPAAPSAKRSSTDQQRHQQQSREGPSALGVMNYLRNTMHRLGPTGVAAGEPPASSSGDLREPLIAGSSSSIDGAQESLLDGGNEGGTGTGGGGRGDSAADAAVWSLVGCFEGRSSTYVSKLYCFSKPYSTVLCQRTAYTPF